MKFLPRIGTYGLAAMLLLSSLAAGCSSSAPYSPQRGSYQVERIDTVDHWDNMARLIADRVVSVYNERNDLLTRPIFVQQPTGMQFSTTFHELLRSSLVSRGLRVSEMQEADSPLLEYDVQLIRHRDRERVLGSSFDTGREGEVFRSPASRRSQHEIVVTARLLYNNHFAMHLSLVCFIDDTTWALYAADADELARGQGLRRVHIVPR